MLALQIGILGAESLSARNLLLVPVMYAVTIVPVIVGGVMLARLPRLSFLS